MNSTVKYLWLIPIGLLLGGCAVTVVKPAGGNDDAKAFAPDADRALVYVFRDNAFLGGKLTSQFVVNNRVAAETTRNGFNIVSLSPGTYGVLSVSSHESNVASGLIHNSKKTPLPLAVEAGKIYFVQEIFKPVGGFSVKVVPQAEAEPAIRKGKLIAINKL
jgi:hypothetical protein